MDEKASALKARLARARRLIFIVIYSVLEEL